MLQDIVSKNWNSVKKKLPKIVVIGGLALATAGALGQDYSARPEASSKMSSQKEVQQDEKTYREYREKIRALPKENLERYVFYGTIAESDLDDNPDLRFVIQTGLTVEAYMLDRRFEKLPGDMKKYLVLVERKFEDKFAAEITAIRKDINQKPYRVYVWTADWEAAGKQKIEGKYNMKVYLRGLFVYDKNPPPHTNEPDRTYTLGGIIGSIIGGAGGNPIKK
jgi:hypothetical protein